MTRASARDLTTTSHISETGTIMTNPQLNRVELDPPVHLHARRALVPYSLRMCGPFLPILSEDATRCSRKSGSSHL